MSNEEPKDEPAKRSRFIIAIGWSSVDCGGVRIEVTDATTLDGAVEQADALIKADVVSNSFEIEEVHIFEVVSSHEVNVADLAHKYIMDVMKAKRDARGTANMMDQMLYPAPDKKSGGDKDLTDEELGRFVDVAKKLLETFPRCGKGGCEKPQTRTNAAHEGVAGLRWDWCDEHGVTDEDADGYQFDDMPHARALRALIALIEENQPPPEGASRPSSETILTAARSAPQPRVLLTPWTWDPTTARELLQWLIDTNYFVNFGPHGADLDVRALLEATDPEPLKSREAWIAWCTETLGLDPLDVGKAEPT